jgi:hypothetical protein
MDQNLNLEYTIGPIQELKHKHANQINTKFLTTNIC